MNAQSAQVEITLEANATLAPAESMTSSDEAVKELSCIELAYVGGGTATFAWY